MDALTKVAGLKAPLTIPLISPFENDTSTQTTAGDKQTDIILGTAVRGA